MQLTLLVPPLAGCIVSFCIGNNYRDLTAASPPAGGSALTDAPVAQPALNVVNVFTTLPLRATQHAIRQLADEGCFSSPIERPALITKAASLDKHKGIASRQGLTLKQSTAVRYPQRFQRTNIYFAFCCYLEL